MLAAQVHADGFRAALVGLGGRIVATAPGRMAPGDGPEAVLAQVVAAGTALLRETGRRCVGAGLAVPSAVAEPEGTALNPLHLSWQAGVPVRDLFSRALADAGVHGPFRTAARAGLRRQRRERSPPSPNTGTAPAGARGTCWSWAPDTAESAAPSCSTGGCTPAVPGWPWRSGTSPSTRRAGPATAVPAAAWTARPTRWPSWRPPGGSRAPRCPCWSRPARSSARSTPATNGSGRPSHGSSTGSASASPGWSTSSTPTASCSADCTAQLLEADGERLRSVVADRSLWGRSGQVPVLACSLAHNSLVGAAEMAWQPLLDDPLGVLG